MAQDPSRLVAWSFTVFLCRILFNPCLMNGVLVPSLSNQHPVQTSSRQIQQHVYSCQEEYHKIYSKVCAYSLLKYFLRTNRFPQLCRQVHRCDEVPTQFFSDDSILAIIIQIPTSKGGCLHDCKEFCKEVNPSRVCSFLITCFAYPHVPYRTKQVSESDEDIRLMYVHIFDRPYLSLANALPGIWAIYLPMSWRVSRPLPIKRSSIQSFALSQILHYPIQVQSCADSKRWKVF